MALRGDVSKVLEGSLIRDEVFGVIYTIDEDDDWTSLGALQKANPNYGVSVFPDFLLTEQRAAVLTARKQGVFKTKHLCVWVGANAAFFNVHAWKALGDPGLKPEQFLGLPCVVSVDLSTKRDITARVTGFKKIIGGKPHYYFFTRFYLPAEQANRPEAQHYQGWVTEHALIAHRGATVDFDLVEAETCEEINRCKAREFAFDAWNAAQLSQGVAKGTKAEIVEIPQVTKQLNAPMKEMDALIAEGRVHHDANPVMNWMMGNVVAHEDAGENVFPLKEGEENKIDGAVAALMALLRLMSAAPKRSVYATRGLLTLPAVAAAGVHA